MVKRPRHYCKACGISVCDLCSQTSRRLSKMDKKEYRVCDICDHKASNYQFKEKLQADLEKKKEIGQIVKNQIAKMEEKLSSVGVQYERYKKTYESKAREVKFQSNELKEKIKFGTERLNALDENNDELKKQIESYDEPIKTLT